MENIFTPILGLIQFGIEKTLILKEFQRSGQNLGDLDSMPLSRRFRVGKDFETVINQSLTMTGIKGLNFILFLSFRLA